MFHTPHLNARTPLMKVENLRDLKKLVSFCRKNGLYDVKLEGFEFKLTPDLPTPIRRIGKSVPLSQDTEMTTNYSAEQMLFWSSQAIPHENSEAN